MSDYRFCDYLFSFFINFIRHSLVSLSSLHSSSLLILLYFLHDFNRDCIKRANHGRVKEKKRAIRMKNRKESKEEELLNRKKKRKKKRTNHPLGPNTYNIILIYRASIIISLNSKNIITRLKRATTILFKKL